MDIGFRFALKPCSRETVFLLLEQLANEKGHLCFRDEDYMVILICQGGKITIVEEEEGIYGYCETDAVGPGFHVAAIEFIDAFADASRLLEALEDTTGYAQHRDFEALRREYFYPWLDALIAAVAVNPLGELGSSMCLCWDSGQYLPESVEGTVITPMGRFSMDKLTQRVAGEGIEAFAGDFFIWPEQERDARCHRNEALALLWQACYFMPSRRSGEDRQLNRKIIALLEEAARLDKSGTLPLPLTEYQLLCALDEHKAVDFGPRPAWESDFPIGYRRGIVREQLGNLYMYFPGHYLYQEEPDERHVFYDGAQDNWHRVGLSGFASDEPEEEFDEELFGHAVEPVVEFLVRDGRCRAAYAGELQGKNGPVHQVIAEILCGNQVIQITCMYQKREEKQWAFDLLRKMSAYID